MTKLTTNPDSMQPLDRRPMASRIRANAAATRTSGRGRGWRARRRAGTCSMGFPSLLRRRCPPHVDLHSHSIRRRKTGEEMWGNDIFAYRRTAPSLSTHCCFPVHPDWLWFMSTRHHHEREIKYRGCIELLSKPSIASDVAANRRLPLIREGELQICHSGPSFWSFWWSRC